MSYPKPVVTSHGQGQCAVKTGTFFHANSVGQRIHTGTPECFGDAYSKEA